MKKWLMLISAGMILTACGTTQQENETSTETEETAEVENEESQTSSNNESESQVQENTETESTESESTQTEESNETPETSESSNDTVQTSIDEARTQLNEGETDQAVLTIRTIEEQHSENLTEEETNQIEELKQAIDNEKVVQAENNQASDYQEVRESTVINENYQQTTGENLDDASDEEVETWLNEEETADSQDSSQRNSSDQNHDQESSDNQTATEQELENYALEQVTAQTDLLNENYTYFTDLQEDGWVQVEIREQHSDGEVGWTTMVGFYRYNVETDTLETMDPITGDFN